MIQHHNWSLSELEDMLPFEREVYSGLLIKHLEAEKAEHDKQQRQMKG